MRIPRSIQLFEGCGVVHQFWRCHNKEFYLTTPKIKTLYMNSIIEAFSSHNKTDQVSIQAYAVMDNHFHSLMTYQNGSSNLSVVLRQAHSIFGARYNRIHSRSGKVAEGRPKTSVVGDEEHQMRVHFYIESNPIRAGKMNLKQLCWCKYSTYRFYAYGIRDEFSKLVSIPQWYMNLGANRMERQARYRGLFLKYLRDTKARLNLFSFFIGNRAWREKAMNMVQLLLIKKVEPSAEVPPD